MPYASVRDKRANDAKRRLAASVVINKAKQGQKCTDCGLPYPAPVLDFDHRDPEGKATNISNMVRLRSSAATIRAEIDKCDIVCANCHRMRTFGLTNPYRDGIISSVVKLLNKMR